MQHRKKFPHAFAIAILMFLFGLPAAQAQSSGASAAQGSSTAGKSVSKSDENLMRELAQSNLAEIETGKVALSQSKNEQVRNFAQRMIDDHTQAQQELSQLAQAKGVTLPAEPDSKHKTALKKLAALQGDQFDKKYIAQGGLNDHRETHRLLQRTQSLATDPDLKALATKMTSVVDQHLTMAEEVGNAKTSSGASGTTSGTGQSGVSGSPGSGKQ